MAWAEQLESGRWRGVYRRPDGKRRSVGTFAQKKQAEREATAKEVEAQRAGRRGHDRGHVQMSEWLDTWWHSRNVEPSTSARDESRLTVHLRPAWDDRWLDEITRQDVREWSTELAKTGLKPATVQRCVSLLSSALTAAVDAELIDVNPAYRLRLPSPDNARERYLTRAEAAALLAVLSGQDRAIVAFLLGTGVRWGELAGARLEDYDRDRSTYRVVQTLDAATRELKPYPKGKRRRTVPVPPWVAADLRPLIGRRRTGLIFTTDDGTPLHYSNWLRRVFSRALVAADIEGATIHTLRHTYASWLIQAGVPLSEVGRLLGHQSMQTTQRYAHLIEEAPPIVHDALRDAPGAQRDPSSDESGSDHGANLGQDQTSPRLTTPHDEPATHPGLARIPAR